MWVAGGQNLLLLVVPIKIVLSMIVSSAFSKFDPCDVGECSPVPG